MKRIESFFKKYPVQLWGFTGVAIIGLGCLVTALGFESDVGQRYSILHFFISELGGAVSKAAFIFNGSLMLGGILLFLFMLGLMLKIKTKFGYICGSIGIFSAVNCIGVGLFPWDTQLTGHIITAMAFFYSGMITVFLFSILIFIEKGENIPRNFAWMGLVVALIFAAFLFLPLGEFMELSGERSGIWWTALLEWMVLFGVLVWIALISAFFARKKTE